MTVIGLSSILARARPISGYACDRSAWTAINSSPHTCFAGTSMAAHAQISNNGKERQMPLNLSVSDGDFTPYLKYNAKAGRFYASPENGDEVEIDKPLLAFDMANIKTGWLYYAEGVGPEKVWDPAPGVTAERPANPDKKFKRGFEVLVFSNAVLPGTHEKLGLREFSSTASSVITSIMRMHIQYEAGLKTNPGKIPVYACVGVKAITGKYGTNYEPLFELRQWAPRSKIPAFDMQVAHQTTPLPRVDPISTGNGSDFPGDRPMPQRAKPARDADLDDEINF